MSSNRDPDRLIHDFLMEGGTELADPVFDAVRATIERKRQRAVIGLWRMPDMNKLVPLGAGLAAVAVAVIAGAQLLPPAAPGGGSAPSATAAPTTAPSSTPVWFGLPEGPVTFEDGAVPIAVDIASPGWSSLEGLEAVSKDDDGVDPPQTVGAALLAWSWPAGTGFDVYGDPCQWSTTIPATPATTPDEIATAFASQASTDATAPVDVTVGGYAGKAIMLTVPMTYEVPGASREEEFADCDESLFAIYGIEGVETEVARNAQGPGQIDELWILDVDGSIVILDASYSPATPADLIEELRTLAESATFE